MADNVQAVVVPPPPARNPVDQDLAYIGFGTEVNRNNTHNKGGLEAFIDLVGLTIRNISDMASGFSKRTNTQGHINFWIRRVKYTLGTMHWVQDDSRCSCTASLTVIYDAKENKSLLGIALDCATIKMVKANQADTIRNVSDLGKFKDKRTWPKWEVKSENYLSTIPGVNIVPLSYVVQHQAAPDCTIEFQGDFIYETIACAPLSGSHFQADTKKVHQILKNYLVAETAEQ